MQTTLHSNTSITVQFNDTIVYIARRITNEQFQLFFIYKGKLRHFKYNKYIPILTLFLILSLIWTLNC